MSLKCDEGVSFECADEASWFTCPECGEEVSIYGKHHPSEREWRSPFKGPWGVVQLPLTCDCGAKFFASWETHVEVTVERVDESTGEAHTIAEGTY